jgi:hypothetical protein
MGKDKTYFSGENLDILYNILKADIFKKFKYDLDANSSFYKTHIFNSMSTIYTTNKEKSLKELNTIVLKTVIPEITIKVKDTLLRAKSNIRDSEIIDRTEDLKKQSLVNMRPISTSDDKNTTNMDTQMENVMQERDSLNSKPNIDMNRFQSDSDKAMDIKSIEKEMKKRNVEINIDENSNDLNKISTPDMNHGYQSDFTDIRMQDQANSILINKNADPNDIYRKNMEDFSQLNEVLKDKSEQNENPIDLLIPTNDIKYTYKQNIVTLCSIDRDWNDSNSSRYNYSVFFNAANDTYQ